MDSYTWTASLHEELQLFKDISALLPMVATVACEEDGEVHLPGCTHSCFSSANGNCVLGTEQLYSSVMDTDFMPCFTCFADLADDNHFSTRLFTVYRELAPTLNGSGRTALDAMAAVLARVSECEYETFNTLPGSVRDTFTKFSDTLKASCVKALRAQGAATITEPLTHIVVHTTAFFFDARSGANSSTSQERYAQEILAALDNEIVSAYGISAMRVSYATLMEMQGNYIIVEETPTVEVLRSMRVFLEDGMCILDAYSCAAALS